MNETLHKEIDLIQSCISRMAQNSFTIKGLSLTCLSIIAVLLIGKLWWVKTLLILPVLGFWFLDAYYLHLERLYRALYKWVIENRMKGNMELLYDLNPNRFAKQELSIWECAIKTHNLLFYGLLIFLVILLTII